MRIRNNNVSVFLLALMLGVLVAFYSRVSPTEYLGQRIGHHSIRKTQASEEVL